MEGVRSRRYTRGLEKVKICFEKMMTEKDRYLDNFEEWTYHRRLTLSELDKFQKELDRIHQYANTGRVVGNGATVLGSLAAVIGFGLSFSKDLKPIASELMKYGSAVGTVGGAASLSASLAELGFNAKVLKEVKAALKKDWQLTQELLPWFERAKELDSALKEVFGCGLTDGIGVILQLIREMYSLYQSGGKVWDDIQRYLFSQATHNFSANGLQNLDIEKWEKILCNASYKVKLLLQEFCNNSSVRRATWEIYESFKKNPVSFDLSKISIRIVRKATAQQNSLIAGLTSSLGNQSLVKGVGLTLQGVFKTVSLALSVLAFISAVEDIKDGKSKYYAIIEEVKIGLKKELESLESYPMLRK